MTTAATDGPVATTVPPTHAAKDSRWNAAKRPITSPASTLANSRASARATALSPPERTLATSARGLAGRQSKK